MQIVKHYTGNPLLNNAMMTIKALAGLSSISELTTEVLREKLMKVYDDLPYSLMDLDLRFKNYTMLFTKNGPLYNDKKLGKQIYQREFGIRNLSKKLKRQLEKAAVSFGNFIDI